MREFLTDAQQGVYICDMVALIKAAQLLLSLSILVVLHEFGHYWAARAFKTRVEKFYLFMNPGFSLFKKQFIFLEKGATKNITIFKK